MGQNLSAPLFQAASAGDVEAIRALLDQRVDVNTKSEESEWTALHYAAWGGQAKAARELLVRGADVNARDTERKTPLHFAVLNGSDATVQALCEHGASVNAAADDGQTPLHKAAAQGQFALVQELTARGANLEARLQDGSTAAHLAAWKGHAQLLSFLLHNGADANAKTLDGETPLHEAAKAGHEDCCRLLVQRGASKAALDQHNRTPADAAQLNNLLGIAEAVRPQAKEVEENLRRQQASRTNQPSAPQWEPQSQAPIRYPLVQFPAQQSQLPEPASRIAAGRPARQGLPGAEQAASDWEPSVEDDWEGVPPVSVGPSQGSRLVEGYAEGNSSADPFWMIPPPIKWAAASFGGVLSNLNPFRGQPDASQPNVVAAEASSTEPSVEAQQARIDEQEAQVARLSEPRTRERLTADQLARLSRQEAEIAELRQKLGAAKRNAAASGADGIAQVAADERPAEASAQRRHHIISVPQVPASFCREIEPDELYTATNGFGAANQLRTDASGTFYSGVLQGSQVTVWVPNRRNSIPWHALKATTDRLAGIASRNVTSIRAVCRDGSLVLDHLPNGSVEDALRGRATVQGTAPIRLNWPKRAEAACGAAQGLLDLHRAEPPLTHSAVKPSNVLLTNSLQSQLTPPNLVALIFGTQAEASCSAPEVRRGEPPTAQADVYSLGILLLQLLTGSESSGLLQYVQSAVAQGRLADILDPCADGITSQSALPFAKLALRCLEFHPEDRPSLEHEVLPALQGILESAKAQPRSEASEEAPPHLICPITQEVMEQPVILADGYTYEESAIKRWLEGGKQVSPMTNAALPHLDLTPNFVIKSAASTWREQHATENKQPRPQAPPENSDLDQRIASLNQQLRSRHGGANEQPEGSSGGSRSEAGDENLDLPSAPTFRIPVQSRAQQRQGRESAWQAAG